MSVKKEIVDTRYEVSVRIDMNRKYALKDGYDRSHTTVFRVTETLSVLNIGMNDDSLRRTLTRAISVLQLTLSELSSDIA